MSYTRNYIIAGGRGKTPSSLSVNLEPVKLGESMGVAVKSIAYGEIHNINESNNEFRIRIKLDILSNMSPEAARIVKRGVVEYSPNDDEEYFTVNLKISNGRYDLCEDVLSTVADKINEYLEGHGFKFRCSTSKAYGIMYLEMPTELRIVSDKDESPLTLIEAKMEDRIVTVSGHIPAQVEMCFVYLNIVQNSFINGRKSRLLCICPIESKKGYSFFEFSNPTYVPIEIREFSNITITLRNVKGQLVSLSNRFDTVITLHMTMLPK